MLAELNEQHIRKTSVQLGIPADFVRKDYFVTQAIQALTQVEDEYFALVFQGGTSLSKGHQVISRLSEDVDFRIIQKSQVKLGKENKRKKLQNFRYNLVQALKDAKFQVPEEAVRVFYEGRFMSVQAEFQSPQKITYLKPHIAIECFLGELVLEPRMSPITSLIKLTLGEECDHTSFPVNCVSLDETAAEKWVALTRRVANTQIKSRQSDKHLVRHLYDLYHLKSGSLLTGDYRTIVNGIIEKDREQFKKHNPDYSSNPVRTSELALDLLFNDPQWKNHWDIFLEQMVYEKNKPSFNKACEQLQILSQEIFQTLKSEQA